MGPFTNITHYILHIIQLKFSTNNTHHITTKIGLQNYIIPTQSPTSFSLWAKPKESPNSPKSHYDVANSVSHYDVVNSKPTMMWHYLQSPLLHGTSKAWYDLTSLKDDTSDISKTRYDSAPLNPVATRHHLLSPLLHGNTLQNLKIIFTKPK